MNFEFQEIELPLFLAFKSLVRGNKGISILTIFVLALVFNNLTFISGLFNGVEYLFGAQTRGTALGDIFVEPYDEDVFLKNPDTIQRKLEGTPGVVATSARFASGAQISADSKQGTWNAFFIDPEDEQKITIFDDNIVSGSYLEEDDVGEILIGKEISGGYGALKEIYSLGGVKVGDKVTLTFTNGFSKEYRVKGIYATKFIVGDEFVFLTKNDMLEVMGFNDRATSVIIKVDDLEKLDMYKNRFAALNLGGVVRTWEDGAGMIKSLQDTFSIFNILLSSIAFMVAAITLFIVIYINTLSKKRQIGVLKAIGVTDKVIIRSFLFQSIFYAVTGIAIGISILHFVILPYFVQNPLFLPIGDVYLISDDMTIFRGIAGLLAAATIAGFFPAARAASQPMLDSIWGK